MPPITSPPSPGSNATNPRASTTITKCTVAPAKPKTATSLPYVSSPIRPPLMWNTTIQPTMALPVPGACTRQQNQSPRLNTAKLLKKRLNTQRWYFINRGTRNPQLAAMAPNKSKIAAGLTCGALWTIAKGIQMGDLVICLNSMGNYWIAEVPGNYQYTPDCVLPHRPAARALYRLCR